jgi:hypothetical protein
MAQRLIRLMFWLITAGIILWAVRWYLQFPISYRDLERMLADRGIQAAPGPGFCFPEQRTES